MREPGCGQDHDMGIKQAVQQRAQRLGAAHPEVAWALGELGGIALARGDADAALAAIGALIAHKFGEGE